MEQGNGVTMKGTQDGLTIHISPELSLDEMFANLNEKFKEGGTFFKDSEIILDLGLRPFQESEFRSLCEIFSSSGVKVKGILSDNPITKLMAQREGLALLGDRSIMSSRVRVDHPVKLQRLKAQKERETQPSRGAYSSSNRDLGLFSQKTLRAGQKLHFVGDITILGDVNPGAEVVAGGSIIVFGTLRGVAHAGAEGRTDVVVAALDLRPTQLRIADCIARAPEKSEEAHKVPELAKIQNDQIIIEVVNKI